MAKSYMKKFTMKHAFILWLIACALNLFYAGHIKSPLLATMAYMLSLVCGLAWLFIYNQIQKKKYA
jgi:hypothetical protein